MQLRALLFAGLVVAALAIGGTLAFAPWNGSTLAQSEPALQVEAPRPVPQDETQIKLSFAPVVRAVAPSVVPRPRGSRLAKSSRLT